MVWDLRRGLDLLWNDPSVDRKRIIVLGGVAGGGDLAAVVGALDTRVSSVVAFNFGATPIGEWDSTRCLAGTACEGFWPWIILASIAPRPLVYGREFSWNPQRDTSWQLLEKVYALYRSPSHLKSVHGSGRGSSHGPEDTHCTNIGAIHRRQLYSIFREWFGIPPPSQEATKWFRPEQLVCVQNPAWGTLPLIPVREVCRNHEIVGITAARSHLEKLELPAKINHLQQKLAKLLGPISPVKKYLIRSKSLPHFPRSERFAIEIEPGALVHLELFRPPRSTGTQIPVVIGFAQEGIRQHKYARWSVIHKFLENGALVCLTELSGTGDGRHGELYRGRISLSTQVAATSRLLGKTLVGDRIRDLRTIIAFLRQRREIDPERIVLWGDSLAPCNRHSDDVEVPYGVTPFPNIGEPLGGIVAMMGALFEPEICAVYTRGSLVGYESLLASPFVYQPADSLIPGLLTVGDLCDVAAALAPRPLLMEGLVDGVNRPVGREELEKVYRGARDAYYDAGVPENLRIECEPRGVNTTVDWLFSALSSPH